MSSKFSKDLTSENIASMALLYEGMPLAYIATHSGFPSETDFYRTFKKYMGITPLEYRSHILHKGEGSIIINSKPYPIKRGMLICLGSYHYFQIKPSNVSIELMQCRLSYDTFLYMAANPYYDFSTITLNPKPLTALLEDGMLERAENIIEELVDTSSKSRKKENSSTYKDTVRSENISDRFIHKSGKGLSDNNVF